jgi:hypothetical protein
MTKDQVIEREYTNGDGVFNKAGQYIGMYTNSMEEADPIFSKNTMDVMLLNGDFKLIKNLKSEVCKSFHSRVIYCKGIGTIYQDLVERNGSLVWLSSESRHQNAI